jgi:methylmalonyl-CoA mutase N-terminal domain/subunit
MGSLEDQGGIVSAIESGRLQQLIGDSAAQRQRSLESGDEVVVGVNRYRSDAELPDVQGFSLDEAGIEAQLERLREVRRVRERRVVMDRLEKLERAATTPGTNLMPLLIDCATAYCTLGEIADVLRSVWGEFHQPKVF